MQHWVKWVFDNFEEVPSSNNFSASYRRCFVNPPQKDIWKTSVMEFFSVKLPNSKLSHRYIQNIYPLESFERLFVSAGK